MAESAPAVAKQQKVSSSAAEGAGHFNGEYFIHAALALLIILFFLPVMALVAAAVALQDGGPVIFAHKRIGRNGQPFLCYKFRSMRVDAEARLAELLAADPAAREEWARDHKLRNDPRVTPLGNFLRPMSVDNGWDREVFALAVALQTLLYGAVQPFTGALADRFGTLYVITASALAYSLGIFLMAHASTPGMLLASLASMLLMVACA